MAPHHPSAFVEYHILLKISRRDIGYVCSTLESYHHVAKVTTIDEQENIVECLVPGGTREEFESAIRAFQSEGISIEPVQPTAEITAKENRLPQPGPSRR